LFGCAETDGGIAGAWAGWAGWAANEASGTAATTENIAKWFQRNFVTAVDPSQTLRRANAYHAITNNPKLTQDEPAGPDFVARFGAQIRPCQPILKQLGSIRLISDRGVNGKG
jgi:hypothetical protein